MKRLTTNNTNGILDRVTNCCTMKNGQAVLHFNSGDVPFAQYVAGEARKNGCNVTEEEVSEGDECLICECPIAILNNVGVQAAENSQRLKEIEDILCGEGDDYDLDRLKEIAEAEKDKRCVILPHRLDVQEVFIIEGDEEDDDQIACIETFGEITVGQNIQYEFVFFYDGIMYTKEEFGKEIYTSYEDAEKALKERGVKDDL